MIKRINEINKENKAITLIALVITIIVLLILAGVTISTLTGENGLISKANEAKIATEKSAFKEEIDLILAQAQMGGLESAFKAEDNNATVNKVNGVYEVKYKGEDILISDDYRYIEKVEANTDEWTFYENTGTLAVYKGDLTKKRGNQEIGEVIIPNYYNGKRVKVLGTNLFYNNSQKQYLTKIIISDGIEKIGGSGVFMGCSNITGDLIIPDSVTYIGDMCFLSCTSLDGIIKLSNNLTHIGGSAFAYCNKITGDLIIPDSVTYIGGSAFGSCTSFDGILKLSDSLETLGSQAFSSLNKLKGNIVIPEQVGEIGYRAFYNCSSINSIKILNRDIQIVDSDNDTIYRGIKIIGYKNSTAETYATNHTNMTFESID